MVSVLITLLMAQLSCLEVNNKSAIYEYPDALRPKVIGWVYPGQVYKQADVHYNDSGKLTHYMLYSKPPGWVEEVNLSITSCN